MNLELSDDKKYLVIRECTQEEYDQLKVSYTKKVDGYRYNPLYKRGLWDGNISFVKGANIPSGTYMYLEDVAKEYGFALNVSGLEKLGDENLSRDAFDEWLNDFFSQSKFKPRDYQADAAFGILKNRRCLSELATSAGKTLICFIVIAYLLDNKKIEGKVLMIVPTVQLVMQSAGDFEEYNTERLPLVIQQIYAGFKMKQTANIMVGTYQSLVKMDNEFYKQFDCVLVDECHKSKAKSIKDILEKCWHAEYRFGVSGTMPKLDSADGLTLQTYLGPLVTRVKAKELQDRGFISKCKIVQLRLDYTTDKTKEAFYLAHKKLQAQKKGRESYELEKNFIIENEKRFNFIIGLVEKTTKNTLLLFHRKAYGRKIFAKLKQMGIGKRVYYIDGDIDKDVRKEITDRMDKYDDVVLVASYQTLGTGISVNQIYNIIFTESFKSQFIIIQSIGRGLRLKDKMGSDKNMATIIDIVDDFRYKSYQNYLYRHGVERMAQYKEQQYPYEVKKLKW